MKSQLIPEIPSLDLASNHDEILETALPSSPKMRQIIADYEAAHSLELQEQLNHIDKRKYH